jgi:hypothetical protein
MRIMMMMMIMMITTGKISDNDHLGCEDIDKYIRKQVDGGYISEDGYPLKCICGCTKFKHVDQYYGEGWIEEYSLECTNIDCLKIVGHWSFGNWEV